MIFFLYYFGSYILFFSGTLEILTCIVNVKLNDNFLVNGTDVLTYSPPLFVCLRYFPLLVFSIFNL